jgi:hypothetical protein
MGVVLIEGKPITLDDEIIKAGKQTIRDALWVDFPDIEIEDIEIQRSTAAGAPLEATVVKRGQGKGQVEDDLLLAQQHVIRALEHAPEFINPAIALAAKVMAAEARGDYEFYRTAFKGGLVERAVAGGEREGRAVVHALKSLASGKPSASVSVPEGF